MDYFRLATETGESKYNSLGLRDRRRLINDVMQELERTSRRGVLGMAKADLLVAKQEERTLMSPVFQGYLEDRVGIQWRADFMTSDFETYPNYQKLFKFTL